MEKYNKIVKNISIVLKTGLHIGSGNDDVQIGGVDSAVVKDPITQLPIIPGSSLKGKLRFLLDTDIGNKEGELSDEINLYFGATSQYLKGKKKSDKDGEEKFQETPTRILFRDLYLSKEISKKHEQSDMDKMSSGDILTEFKSEIKMDRQKGKVDTAGPRTIERVPAGITFAGEIIIRYKDEEEKKKIETMLQKSFDLIKMDALGGSGSRGYGQVEIKFI